MICFDAPRAWEVWVRYSDRESAWRKYRTTDSLKVAEHTVARCSGDQLELKIVPLYAAEQEEAQKPSNAELTGEPRSGESSPTVRG